MKTLYACRALIIAGSGLILLSLLLQLNKSQTYILLLLGTLTVNIVWAISMLKIKDSSGKVIRFSPGLFKSTRGSFGFIGGCLFSKTKTILKIKI
jgi:hypothetical protein